MRWYYIASVADASCNCLALGVQRTYCAERQIDKITTTMADSTTTAPMMIARRVPPVTVSRSTNSQRAPRNPKSHLKQEKRIAQLNSPKSSQQTMCLLLVWQMMGPWLKPICQFEFPVVTVRVQAQRLAAIWQSARGGCGPARKICSRWSWPAGRFLVFLQVATQSVHAVARQVFWTLRKVARPWICVWAGK